MKVFKAFAAVVFIYMALQGIIWLARGNTLPAIIILACSPLLLIVWRILKHIFKKQDEKIEQGMAYSAENLPKSSLFKDE